MTKSLLIPAVLIGSALMANAQTADSDNLSVLTFEDADFKGNLDIISYKPAGMTADTYWSSLIDSVQYNGPQLYGDVPYSWCDAGNTNLQGAINNNYGYMFWNGGAVISNYVTASYDNIDYTRQLEAYTSAEKGGVDGSDNFLVCNGYYDTSAYGGDKRPVLTFANGEGKMMYAYINLSAYGLSAGINGNPYCPAVAEGDWLDVVAQPYDAEGNLLNEGVTIRLIDGPDKITSEWTKWDLSALGSCNNVRFDMRSSMVGEWGMNFPAYFLLDNIAVANDGVSAISTVVSDETDNAIYTIMGVRVNQISAPGIYIVNGKKLLVK